MNAIVNKSFLSGTVNAVPSKSVLHRVLIASVLSDKKTIIKNVINSADILATEDCLVSLGAEILHYENSVSILPLKGGKTCELFCGESGSTLRFLLPVVCALNTKATFTGINRLNERPIKKLLTCLEKCGAVFSSDTLPITVEKGIESGKFLIDGNVSSQYVSGLLFALPLLSGDSEIILTSPLSSVGYVDITLKVLSDYGIKIKKTNNGFFVKGNQNYISPQNYCVEGDYSNAAFFAANGILNGNIVIEGLDNDSLQGDKQIIELLKLFGAKTDGKHFQKSDLNAIVTDGENIPDLIPILSVLCSFAKGKSIIKNVNRLKLKESDRLKAVMDMLSACNITCDYNGNDLSIIGGCPKCGIINGFNDHRIVMAGTVLASCCEGETIITQAEAVKKSYPHFFDDFKKLGGIFNVNNG